MSEVKQGLNLSIRLKLFLFGAVLATASLVIFGSIEYRNAKSAINDLTFAQLTAVREMKAQQIEAAGIENRVVMVLMLISSLRP